MSVFYEDLLTLIKQNIALSTYSLDSQSMIWWHKFIHSCSIDNHQWMLTIIQDDCHLRLIYGLPWIDHIIQDTLTDSKLHVRKQFAPIKYFYRRFPQLNTYLMLTNCSPIELIIKSYISICIYRNTSTMSWRNDNRQAAGYFWGYVPNRCYHDLQHNPNSGSLIRPRISIWL